MQALEDPSIDGIISTIGGEDSVRILPYLNLNTIKANPKLFMGYSDTTATHLAFLNAGVQSFYGPSIMAGIGENGGIPSYLMNSMRETVFSELPSYLLRENITGWTNESQPGGWANQDNQKILRKLHQPMKWRWLQGNTVVSGALIGGCMDVLEFLKGSSYWPSPELFKDSVLFFEIAENAVPARQFGYWLRSYATLGILQNCKAILFARPGGSDRNPECFDEYDQVLLKIVRDECCLSDLPIITRMDFGHTDPMMVIPYGAVAEIDCVAKSIKITV